MRAVVVRQVEAIIQGFTMELSVRQAIAADIEQAAFSEHSVLSEQTTRLYLSAWVLQPYIEEELLDRVCYANKLDSDAWN